MATYGTLCTHCKYFLRANPKAVCEAFPASIPREILFSEVSHKQPYQGDNGLQYERATEEQIQDRLREAQARRKKQV